MLVSEEKEVGLGEEAYQHIMRDSVLSDDSEALRIVRKVGQKIARAANKPNYKWEFRIVNDPEMVNAFAVPGGKVAVYTGIFRAARDEAGLAVVLGHEVAHALARHAGERMSQNQLVQLGGLGLSIGLGGNSAVTNGVLQAYGLGTGVLILPFSRSQESEADEIGLILMAKAGYDPRVSLEVWERMEKQESGKNRGSPPEFLSTHPGYETRTQKLRAAIPKALTYYRPSGRTPEKLPSPETLDSPTAKAERKLLKRIQKVNQQAGDPQGQRAVVEAIGYSLRMKPSEVVRDLQQLRLGFGQYAALKEVSSSGRTSLRRVLAAYERGNSWGDITQRNGIRMTKLLSYMRQLLRDSVTIRNQSRNRQPQRYRPR